MGRNYIFKISNIVYQFLLHKYLKICKTNTFFLFDLCARQLRDKMKIKDDDQYLLTVACGECWGALWLNLSHSINESMNPRISDYWSKLTFKQDLLSNGQNIFSVIIRTCKNLKTDGDSKASNIYFQKYKSITKRVVGQFMTSA